MDLKQWENMWAFHSLPTSWPAISQLRDSMPMDELVLRQTMLHPSLDTAWCPTYAWTPQLDYSQQTIHSIVTPICTTNRLPRISHAMWNYRQGFKLQTCLTALNPGFMLADDKRNWHNLCHNPSGKPCKV